MNDALEMTEEELKGIRILLVDDEADNLEILQEFLGLSGAEVLIALGGHQGLEMARRRPDIIITDLAMPEMTGYELIMALKDDRATVDIPVIALTGHVFENFRVAAFEAGCQNFLVKPVHMELLVKEIQDLLGKTQEVD